MTPAWEDHEQPDTQWGDPEAWRGDVHRSAEEAWAPDPSLLWGPLPAEDIPLTLEEDLLGDEDDWIPGGWLEEWEGED